MAKGETGKIDRLTRYSPLQIPVILKMHWNAQPKEPVNFIAEPSTVKSEGVYQFAEAQAKEERQMKDGKLGDEPRIFFNWNQSSIEAKREVIANIGKYFIFADLRASETDIGELRLQNLNGDEYITYKYAMVFSALSHKDAMGVIFFDEMNLAPNMIKAQFYKVINDRAIGDIPINKYVMCVSAGNEAEHSRGVTEDPVPLVLRRGNYFLRPLNVDEYCDFATKRGYHPWVIGFLQWRKELVHRIEYDLADSVGQPCPRTWTKLNNIIMNNARLGEHSRCEGKSSECQVCEEIRMVATGLIGQAAASEFIKHMQSAMKIDIEAILAKPETIRKYDNAGDISQFFAVLAGIVATYRQAKDYKKIFPQALEVCKYTSKVEAGAFLMRSIKLADEDRFRSCLIDPKVLDKKLYDDLVKRFDHLL